MQVHRKCMIVFLMFFLGLHAHAAFIGVERDPVSLEPLENHRSVRSLRAAKINTDIRARSIEGCLEHEIDLHYLDEQTHRTPSQFSARVRMSTRLPTVVLEEIEHHIDEITCFQSSIQLYFTGIQSMELVYNELSSVEEFFVVTSHEGCNGDGIRESHRVSRVSLDEGEQLITLFTSPSRWKDTVHFMALDFGRSSDGFELRQHGGLRPRQAGSPSGGSATAAASSTAITSEPMTSASLTASVSITYPASSSSPPTSTFLSTSLTSATYISQTILPPDTSLGFSGPGVPHFFTLVCKNCSIYGSIEIFSGSLTTNLSNSDESSFAAGEFWEHGGFVELLVNDFSAHIELETTVAPTKTLKTYTAHFPPIAFPLFQIEGIAAVGPQLVPQASMGVEIGAELDFTYGFDIKVPNNSSIKIVVGNITNSSITNFPDTSLTALPFHAELEYIDLTLETGFSPQLLLGATVFDNHGELGAGVFFDLPSVSATVSYVRNVNASCDPVDDSGDAVSGGLTNIVPSVVFDAGLFAEAAISDDHYSIGELKTYQFSNYSLPLPTACLSFDHKASSFAPAVNPASTTTGSSGSRPTSAAPTVASPLTKMVKCVGRQTITLVSLGLIAAFFISS